MKQLLTKFLDAPKWLQFLIKSVVGSLIFILLFLMVNPSAKHILLKSVIFALVLGFYGTYIKPGVYKISQNSDKKKA